MKSLNQYFALFLLGVYVIFFIGCTNNENPTQPYKPSVASSAETEFVIGIHPYLNTEKTFMAYEPILCYLEERMVGVKFRLETSYDYPDYEQKLYHGNFHFSLPNPYQTIQATEHGYTIVAKMKPDKVFRGVIVARKDRHIRLVEQLRNQAISFPASTALAATLMPKLFLYEKGLNVEKEAKPYYVGSQYSSIMNAYSGDAIAAATWPIPWKTWQEENPDKAKEMELIWETPSLINNGFVIRNDVDLKIGAQVIDLLCSLENTTEGKKLLTQAGFEGFEKATLATYAPVKSFLIRYDKMMGLPQ
jgi:phosphonate transport system substrate-binding protein